MDGLDGLSADRREAVRMALSFCTDLRDVRSIARLKGGVSGALICRVDTDQRPFALRVEPERIALEHRQRGFACMEAAAAVDVAPRVFFADPVSGVAVMDFVDARPLSGHCGGRLGVARELGALVGRLQTTKPFARMLGGDEDFIASALLSLEASGPFAAGLLARHRDELDRIRAALPWDPSSLVSSHNDPNPRNLLFDGARLWLVDWELASRNDRLFDLAIATTEIADTPDLEEALLSAALGRPPDAPLRARLRVVRQLTRLFYGCIAVQASAVGRPHREDSLDALTPAQFQAAVGQGRLRPEEIGYAFGKMSLAAFVDGCSSHEFKESLALAREA